MKPPYPFLLALVAVPASAAGPVATAERGSYECEMPGDAAGSVGIARPVENFQILSASRYQSTRGSGVYLRKGDTLRFTSGARKGEAYIVVSRNFLRRLDDGGNPGRLRCVRVGRDGA